MNEGMRALALQSRERAKREALERARWDLWFLCTEILDYDALSETFHRPMLAEWDRVDRQRFKVYREGKGQLLDDLNIWPRDHIKTWCQRARILRYYLIDPTITVTGWHAVEEQMQESGAAIGKHLQFNLKLRRLFPHGVLPAVNSKRFLSASGFRLNSNRVGDAPSFRAWGVGSEATGGHSLVGWLDDVNAWNDVVDSQFTKRRQWYQATVRNVVRAAGWIDGIGTRWDLEDTWGFLMTLPGWRVTVRAALETEGKPDYQGSPVYLSREQIAKKRVELGEVMFCTPDESPVLMSDWTLKPISEVAVGDHVMGFDLSAQRALKPSKVTDKGMAFGPVVTLTMRSGRIAKATASHRWLIGRKSTYRSVHVGSTINSCLDVRRLVAPDGQRARDYAWLAGMIDGEDAVGNRNGMIVIAQDVEANPEVCAEIEAVLPRLGIPFYVHRRKGRASSRLYVLHGGRQMKAEILNHGRPAKSGIIRKRMRLGKPFTQDRIAAITADSDRARVWWLTTETGNYIVWGYASANSLQMMNDPSPAGEKPWDPAACEHLIPAKEAQGPGFTVVLSDPAPAKVGSYAADKRRPEGEKDFWANAVVKFRRHGQRSEIVLLDGSVSQKWTVEEGFAEVARLMRRWQTPYLAVEKTGQAVAFYEETLRRVARREGVRFSPIELTMTYKGKNVQFEALASRAKTDELLLSEGCDPQFLEMFLEQARGWRPLPGGKNSLKYDDAANVVSFATDPVFRRYTPVQELKEWSPYAQVEEPEYAAGSLHVRW